MNCKQSSYGIPPKAIPTQTTPSKTTPLKTTYPKALFRILLASSLLAGCDSHKAPVEGKRESIINLATALEPDPLLKGLGVKLIPAVNLKEWTQRHGSPGKLPPLALGSTPVLLWKASLGKGIIDYQRMLAGLVVRDGIIYGMDAGGDVVAMSADKKEQKVLWRCNVIPQGAQSHLLGGGVIVDAENVFVTTSFGEVLSLNRKDGKILWRVKVNGSLRIPPTLANGRLFVVTINNETFALDSKTGRQLWSHTGITEQSSLLGGANPVIIDNVAIVAYSSGEVCAIQVENGHALWSEVVIPALRVDTVSSIPHIYASPLVDNGQVFVISHGGKIISIDLKTGLKQWQQKIGGICQPALMGEWLFVLSSQGEVFCIDRKTGAAKWIASLPKAERDQENITWTGPLIVNDELVFTGSNGKLQFMKLVDGTLSKTLTYSGQSYLPPIVVEKVMYLLTDQANIYAWQ